MVWQSNHFQNGPLKENVFKRERGEIFQGDRMPAADYVKGIRLLMFNRALQRGPCSKCNLTNLSERKD